MKKKTVRADYYDREVDIEVPVDAQVLEWKDPDFILSDPKKAILEAVRNPIGMEKIKNLVGKGSKVLVSFDDNSRPALPAQMVIPIVVEELNNAGVRDEDITLIAAIGNHRKCRPEELRAYLGEKIFNRFWPVGHLLNHDCHDKENLVHLGFAESGGPVEVNRYVVESDLTIYLSNILARPWGGYTGNGVLIGLASARGVGATHTNRWMNYGMLHSDQYTQEYRIHKDELHAYMEKAIGKKIFYINVLSASGGRLVGVFAGHSPAIQKLSWELGDKYQIQDARQADIIILGAKKMTHYGSTDNPILAANTPVGVVRHWLNKPILKEGGVIIVLSGSRGVFDHRNNPAYEELLNVWDQCHSADDFYDYEEEFYEKQEYIFKYRFCYGFPPNHGFWIFYTSDYMFKLASKIILVGAENPGALRRMCCSTAKDFDEALKIAMRIRGEDAQILVLPKWFSNPLFKFRVE